MLRFYPVLSGGGRGGQKVSEQQFSHFVAPLPVNNDQSLKILLSLYSIVQFMWNVGSASTFNRPVSNSGPPSQTETTSNMRGLMMTLGTIKPSGDKEALYHKLIHTTTTARVIVCKC